jgi:hypothetical protein
MRRGLILRRFVAFPRVLAAGYPTPASIVTENGSVCRSQRLSTDMAAWPSDATILLSLKIENNNKFVRGKKRACEDIERYLRHHYGAIQGRDGDYHLKISYRTDEELDNTVQDLLQHIALEADLRNCFSESDATMEGSDHRNW